MFRVGGSQTLPRGKSGNQTIGGTIMIMHTTDMYRNIHVGSMHDGSMHDGSMNDGGIHDGSTTPPVWEWRTSADVTRRMPATLKTSCRRSKS